MKGILLNQFYSVSNSLRNYFILSVIISGILIFSQNEFMQSFATLIPIIFMATPALEVLKHESKSGWNKFVLTLPLSRNNIIQSHYFFFTMAAVSGLIVTLLLFFAADLIIGDILTESIVYSIFNGLGVALLLGVVAYPFTYYLGAEKSDTVLMIGIIVSVGLFLGSNWVYTTWIEDSLPTQNHELIFTLGFCGITILLFLISGIITKKIYLQKEY